mgnify:CR=1 FL=1
MSPCWKCWVQNVLKGESLAEHDATKYLRDIRCGRGEFDLVSDEEDEGGFVALSRADDDGEVELSTFIARDAARSDEPSAR